MKPTVCHKDCPFRTPTCHSTCEKYLKQFYENREENKVRYESKENDNRVSQVSWNGFKKR